MTDRPPQRCQQVEADLLAGPTDAAGARRIAAHLAACPACYALSRRLGHDRTRLRSYLDGAEWLPVANRVAAALPDVRSRPAMRVTPDEIGSGPAALPPWSPSSARRLPRRRPGRGPIAGTLRAACLVLVGLALGLAVEQVRPRGDDTDGGGGNPVAVTQLAATGSLGGQSGSIEAAGQVGRDGDAAYVPAPGDNPPLIVPGGPAGIGANQNRATWRSVRQTVRDGLSPLLYPPVPPGTFESVVIDSMATNAFAVRYAAEDMDLLMTAGSPAGNPTFRSDTSYRATVRGTAATVTVVTTDVPGQGGLRLDGQPSAALAAGTIVEVTWREPGLLRDPLSGVASGVLPYRVTAAGLPLDVVMNFVDSLVPFGNGGDELRADLPPGTTMVSPTAWPNGLGAVGTNEQSVVGDPTGRAMSYTVGYQRLSDQGVDRIVFSAAPTTGEPKTGVLTVLGHVGSRCDVAVTTRRPAARSVIWQPGRTRYRIGLVGAGITDAGVDRVLGGRSETAIDARSAAASSQSLAASPGPG